MKSAGPTDDSGVLTASIFAESVKQQKNDPEFKEAFLETAHQFFRVLDTNGDGFLQADEYARSFAQVGIQDTSVIQRAFQFIDTNQDGKLSLEEFSAALWEYMTSEDENSPCASLWGPLVDWIYFLP